MPSTRESSPASEVGSPSTPQLSPNSKVKALLAQFDNNSDKSDQESVSGDARARLVKAMNASKVSSTDAAVKDTIEEAQKDVSTAEEESDEEEIVKPRGRVAGAMRAQKPSNKSSTPTRSPTNKGLPSRQNTTEPASGSEESDVPVVSRKRKIRVSRHSTPELNLQDEPTSPGLFVSPNAESTSTPADPSDSDGLPTLDDDNARFKALVAKKGKEMRDKAQAAQELRQKKEAELQRYSDALDEDDLVGSDEEGGRRLTQQMKPTRKASKRALDEMHRETQRLSRNQQLAHYATTKKKYSTKDFLKRFERKLDTTPELPPQQSTEPTSSSPARRSDAEIGGTPPTSPPSVDDHPSKLQYLPSLVVDDNDDDLPTLEGVLSSSPPRSKDKGKDRAVEEEIPEPKVDKGKERAIEEVVTETKIPKAPVFKHRFIRVRPPPIQDRKVSPLDDSDSDLEIVTVKPTIKTRIAEVFDRVPAQKGAGNHHALRLLAHLGSPGKQNTGRNKKPSMTTSEMQMSLQQRARQQATREREERLQAARDRGVIIQTTEERQQEMAEVEDLLSRARREGDEITKREKAAAKKERKDSGEADPLGDSSDDEDWVDEKDKVLVEESGSGSGSEAGVEESDSEGDASGEDEEDAMELDDEAAKVTNTLLDDEASATDDDEADAEADADLSMHEMAGIEANDENNEEDLPNLQHNRRIRNVNVISDDEDESQDEQQTPSIAKTVSPALYSDSPVAPTSVLRSATKTFIPGVSVTGPVGLGLTQIFAGTMDDSQFSPSPTNGDFQEKSVEKGSLAFLRRIPAPSLPAFMPTMEEDTQAFPDSPSQMSHIPESQPMEEDTQALDLNFTQSQIHGADSQFDSQMTPFPDATQDVGFADMTPIKGRFVDSPATAIVMDPLTLPERVEETPVVKKKGRLQRRAPVVFSDDEDAAEPIDLGEDFEVNESIFDVMRKAAKPKKAVVDEFDKKKSKAKEMVNEQADESEDEYAGLGGASDDESGGEADEYVKAMIDDEGGQNVDKNQIAAFYADRERANDEKEVEKLYKDITSGMMRRKRGADYDLSDSDDGGEARRRMKRKEFTKMRKALLADERIGKIAENPKRQAFLRAIEDRGSDDDTNFLVDFPEPEEEDSQSQSQVDSPQIIPNSQPGDMGPPKRKRTDDSQDIPERLPPNLRRTKPAKKPSNLSEIRDSLSSLIEEQDSLIVPESGSESDDQLEIEGQEDQDLGPRKQKDKENRDPFALRRTKPDIIDRISLKRESSSTISTTTRLAFAVSTSASTFKIPALLRRATTNNSVTSNSSVTERTAGAVGEGVKRGGGKNSGVNYFARETERRAAVKKTEERREKKRFKGAEGRRKAAGGLLGRGKFE